MKTSKRLYNKQCPSCAENGRDNGKDNLTVYSDGHAYCFSCGFTIHGDRIERFKSKLVKDIDIQVHLPNDVTFRYPESYLKWTTKYDISVYDLMSHGVMWSDRLNRMIFPVYNTNGSIAAYVARSITEKPKWYSVGVDDNLLCILEGFNNRTLVIVEDILSAISVSKYGYTALALFNSNISSNRIRRIKEMRNWEKVYIWLDPDKRQDALKFRHKFDMYGIKARVIYSDKDPKDFNYDSTNELLRNGE